MIGPAGTSLDIYADKGYVNGGREELPKSEGWRRQIQRECNKEKVLFEALERRHRRIAWPRARVKRVFAGMAHLGGNTLRSSGLVRPTLHMNWKAATYNLCRCVY